ncbi:bcl-2-related protein A1 isoform X1 [Rhinolophus ferrumequinum]|uniref:Bcl-2-related protein A1 n=2 Tax=Rhinolophus ferrumequinum TaxID=59479 RepID=A0A671FLY8_RHIFE|nr:bcl-2-related protein A1 isoform X1 [Rhinolophus ferrumequinum]
MPAQEPGSSSAQLRSEVPGREAPISDVSRNSTGPTSHCESHPARLGTLASDFLSPFPVNKLKTLLSSWQKMTDCEFGYIHALAQDYLTYVLQVPQPGTGPSRTSRVLQDIASSVQKEVEKNLKPCLDSFDVMSIDTARTIFNQVMEKEFEDGVINWGRIVTIFAFEGILIKKLLREQITPDVDTYKDISYFVADFITEHTGEWIRQNGGWENGFVKKFGPKSGWLTFLEVTGKICEMFCLLKQYC